MTAASRTHKIGVFVAQILNIQFRPPALIGSRELMDKIRRSEHAENAAIHRKLICNLAHCAVFNQIRTQL